MSVKIIGYKIRPYAKIYFLINNLINNFTNFVWKFAVLNKICNHSKKAIND